MEIALISFTGAGANTCRRVADGLAEKGHSCSSWGKEPFAAEAGVQPLACSLEEWTKASFADSDALVFIGACGIAVRSVAPFIKDKLKDPAVIAADEKGYFAISLLSGHVGGANELAREIASILGAVPVITTATDINGCFAVDEWAQKNQLKITDRVLAKEISASILKGEMIGVYSDTPITGSLPGQLREVSTPIGAGETDTVGAGETDVDGARKMVEAPKLGFRVSMHTDAGGPFDKTLHLVPKTITVGIGCRKGIDPDSAAQLLDEVFRDNSLSFDAIEKFCSIDIKKGEAALWQLANRFGVPLEFYSAEELKEAQGEFTPSKFVKQVTGVDNVCERAAVLGSRGSLMIKKQARNGVTIAVAVRKEEYKWIQESGQEG